MEMKKLLLKSSLLLGSVFLLTACGSNETKEETTVAETTAAVEETTVAETTEAAEETTVAESEEETTAEEGSEEETTAEEGSEEETTAEEGSEEETTVEGESEESTEAAVATEGEELQDGTYTVVGNLDEHGWALKHTIEVKDGKITTSDFDYYNEAGDRKSEDEEYNKNMKDKSGISAAEAMEQLNKALVEGQTAEVEVVSGATHTAENFVKSATALLEKAAKGDTEETNIDEAAVATDSEGLQDGTYTVVGNPDERGWAVKHTIEVKDGKITTSDFDYYNEAGERKTEDEEYNKNMKEKAGVSSKEAIEQLNAALVEGQAAEVEVVSGATHTAENFVKSATALLEKAAKGDTEESNMDEVALVDGEYTLKSNEDERGWAHTFTLVVKDGKVAESKYDMVDKDGNLKSENEEYNTAMKEKTGASFAEAVEVLNAGLVEKQSTDLEAVSGATSTYDSFVEYAKLLLEAAAKGETETIEVEVPAQ